MSLPVEKATEKYQASSWQRSWTLASLGWPLRARCTINAKRNQAKGRKG